MSRFQTIPFQCYNQHLGGHQILRCKINKNIKNFAVKYMQKTKKFFTMGMQTFKDFASGC